MTVDRRRIRDKIRQYRLSDSDFDGVDAWDRAQLITGDGLNKVLQSIEQKLKGLDAQKIHATKNIVLELAGNTLLHGPKRSATPEMLLVTRHRGVVTVWMFGSGRKDQIRRLNQIITNIRDMAEPPDHQDELLRRRNLELLRRTSLPPSKQHGGGTGMMTIAALSSEPLWFLSEFSRGEASFALRSVV